ncbi:MAG: sigma 54-interacting transcriptional regulator [Acidobacteriota bacterium]
MASPSSESTPLRYRLCGRVDDVEYCFDLAIGDHRVGSSPESDVRLPFDSVSRQHAMLSVMADGLAVEDRGSKNGTFVDGRQVDRAAVSAKAKVGFGPVELEVEEVEAEDVDLAFHIDPAVDGLSSGASVFHPSRETVAVLAETEPPVTEIWLRLIESFAERLFAGFQGDPASALDVLLEHLGATGACVAEWERGSEPVLLATRNMAALGPLDAALPDPEEQEPPAESAEPFVYSSTADCTAALLRRSEGPPLGLWVWGDFAGREAGAILFRTLLRLLAGLPSWAIQPTAELTATTGARASHPELIFPGDYLPGVSPAMTAIYRQMELLLDGDLPILVTGETGVGKERLTGILHLSSSRRGGPLVAINCAAIPADLLEAELFGIGKGVATGVTQRAGKFLLAEGGTLMLDEIGELQPALQAKLLRALQEKQIQPVGGRPQSVDVRIVAATNAHLEQRIEEGDFRQDLYYRLAGFQLEIPPLRQCPEDIPRLIEHFMRSVAHDSGIRIRGLTIKALRLLTAYPWPGNIRELHHEIRRLVYLCRDGGVIDAGKLARRVTRSSLEKIEPPPVSAAQDLQLAPQLQRLEDRLIREALRRTGGRQVHAAKLLGISRNGLADKIKRLGIDPRAFRS